MYYNRLQFTITERIIKYLELKAIRKVFPFDGFLGNCTHFGLRGAGWVRGLIAQS